MLGKACRPASVLVPGLRLVAGGGELARCECTLYGREGGKQGGTWVPVTLPLHGPHLQLSAVVASYRRLPFARVLMIFLNLCMQVPAQPTTSKVPTLRYLQHLTYSS